MKELTTGAKPCCRLPGKCHKNKINNKEQSLEYANDKNFN